jgi:hypothetical protein
MLEGGYAHTVFWGPYLDIKKDSQISAKVELVGASFATENP